MLNPPQPIGQFDDLTGDWTLMRPYMASIGNGRWLFVAAGFVSDGASIPRFLWSAVGPRYERATFPAAFVHDALYAAELLPRRECDDIFYHHLRSRVTWAKAYTYWLAVRMFGGYVWDAHDPMEVARARELCRIESDIEILKAEGFKS